MADQPPLLHQRRQLGGVGVIEDSMLLDRVQMAYLHALLLAAHGAISMASAVIAVAGAALVRTQIDATMLGKRCR